MCIRDRSILLLGISIIIYIYTSHRHIWRIGSYKLSTQQLALWSWCLIAYMSVRLFWNMSIFDIYVLGWVIIWIWYSLYMILLAPWYKNIKTLMTDVIRLILSVSCIFLWIYTLWSRLLSNNEQSIITPHTSISSEYRQAPMIPIDLCE